MCSLVNNTWFILLVLVLQQAFLLFSAHGSSKVHIVYMGERKQNELLQVQESHHHILTNALGSTEAAQKSILYSYKHGFSGFAAILTNSEVKRISELPGVVRVVPNKILRVDTTRSWDFLNVKPQVVNGILSQASSGAGSIIGVIDSGIWPESDSFKDDGMDDVPSRWKGICQEGEQFNSSNCNKKIIGARWYIKGYEAEMGELSSSEFEFFSPRDAFGHGTHTASTAAGAHVKDANYATLARGLARGGAPSSWLAVYKVCWVAGYCSSADVLAAFDDAISDGVDVLSVSLGSRPPLEDYMEDALVIGSFHAVTKGITVVCSAGNFGPSSQGVTGIAPWQLTVAASSIDRAFPTQIYLGNNHTFWGQSLLTMKNLNKFHPLVFGGDIAMSTGAITCDPGSLDPTLAKGKVVLCFQSRAEGAWDIAMSTVIRAEGIGLIFAQSPSKDVSFTPSFPLVLVDYTIGSSILKYITSTRKPMVRFGLSRTVVGQQISPEVAFFSSRGPSSLSPHVLKPDITAPGVNILAAWSPVSRADPSPIGIPPQEYKIESGTSMSCPHIAGIVALLKAIHPTWSPAAIKSALITTASTKDEYGQDIMAQGLPSKKADPFDYGGGHVEPNKATDPGLIYDIKTSDYINFLCGMDYNESVINYMTKAKVRVCKRGVSGLINLNLPSISIPEFQKRFSVRRTVTNVGSPASVYRARVEAPPGVLVQVDPSVLAFNITVKKLQFKVKFTSQRRVQGRYSFGNLYWEDGFHVVKTPLVVRSVIRTQYSDT